MFLSDTEIDAIVGQRVRQRREALRMSQSRLGRHLGLTFSQIQKYEKGANRIGAGRLYQIAQYLGVTPGYFFEPVDSAATNRNGGPGGVAREEARTLNEAFALISDPETRRSVLALLRSLTSPEGSARILR